MKLIRCCIDRLKSKAMLVSRFPNFKTSDVMHDLETLEQRQLLSASPLITEFMASNNQTLVDQEGISSDWIELHNPTPDPVLLNGWSLTDDATNLAKWSIPNITLQPDEYLLLFASGNDRAIAGQELHTNFKLSASGEYLALVEPDGITIANQYAPQYPAQSTDISYGLDANGLERYFNTPTPGTINDNSPPVDSPILLSEIMYHPSSENDLEEFIELHNTGTTSIDLTGWRINDGVNFTIPATTLAGGASLVIAADVNAFATKYPTITNVVGGWVGQLSNRGESITLIDSTNRVIDQVIYADEGDWSIRERGLLHFNHRGWTWNDAHDGGGRSLELINAHLPNDYGQNWKASAIAQGTPGENNSVADSDNNTAPLIINASHYPVIPSSTDPVIISARLIDELESGVSARVYWRVDGDPTFTVTTMNDDGTGDDELASDQLFTTTLPAQLDGTIIEFYIEAEDQAHNTRTWPSPTTDGQQVTNLLYQVDDSFDPNNLPVADDQPTYRLIMTEQERAELELIGSTAYDRYSHAKMNGTFISVNSSGISLHYNVGIRNRGAGSSIRQPNSYHVNIPSDRLWNGVDQFNLNTQYTQLQLAGLKLLQASGVIAANTAPVQALINGADLNGTGSPSFDVYIHLENIDGDFLDNHLPQDDGGNLYHIVRGGNVRGDLRDLGTDPTAYYPYYDKNTNAGENDYSDLIDLVDRLNNTSDAQYMEKVTQVVDIENWLRYFAVNALLSNNETALATGVGDDYFLYRGIDDPRFIIIPHDLDTIFGLGDTSSSPTSSIYRATEIPTLNRFFSQPEIASRYHGILKELMQTVFSKQQLDPMLDQTLGSWMPQAEINAMKSFMDARRDYVWSLITTPLSAQSGLPLSGGYPTTAGQFASVNGTAPLADTQSVLVNGQVAQWNPYTGQWLIGDGSQVNETLIENGASWRYLDDGSDQQSAWRDLTFDDSSWQAANAELGYGDNDETTVISYGPQAGDKFITTYFRKTFDLDDPALLNSLSLGLLRDDGASVFINGTEVLRSNLPGTAGDETITFETLASQSIGGAEENIFQWFIIDPSLLVSGLNIVTVEVHQFVNYSSDISFDLQLIATVGTESTTGIQLTDGINHLIIETYDRPNGTGNLLQSMSIDILRQTNPWQEIAGQTINTPMTLTVNDGPYLVTGDLIIGSGGVLTIEPGVTLFFNNGTGISVKTGGQLFAQGQPDNRIQFSHNPETDGAWDGLRFSGSQQDNRLEYIDMAYGDGQGEALYLNASKLLIDHASWSHINRQVLNLYNPTMTVSNSYLPGISDGETIHLYKLNPNEQFIFDNNTVGFNSSGDDVVDLGHNTLETATIYFRNNTFLGSKDDGIDTDGFHVVIENNLFTNFHRDGSRPTTANAVSSGHMNVNGQIISSTLILRNNIFIDNDHHLLLKDGAYAELINNTFLDASLGDIQFTEIGGTSVIGPGLGADIDSLITWGSDLILKNLQPETQLTINRSIVPTDLLGYGTGNIDQDPMMVDPDHGDVRLMPGSPALGTGSNGTDIGAVQMPRLASADATNLRITELQYNPALPDITNGEVNANNDLFEFIELMNTSSQTIDLSGVAFVNGVDFVFESGTSLQPGERTIIVKNKGIFETRYEHLWSNELSVAGEYEGQLSNAGETIHLVAADGSTIQQFKFEDGTGIGEENWPTTPDGTGPSLVIFDTEADYNLGKNWQTGSSPHGTPGIGEPVTLLGDINGDGIVNGFDVDPFVNILLNGPYNLTADMNGDGAVNGFDVDPFISTVLNGSAAPAPVEEVEQPAQTVSNEIPHVMPPQDTTPILLPLEYDPFEHEDNADNTASVTIALLDNIEAIDWR